MTKLDFAIHLFTHARDITSGTAHRTPVVTLLILLILSRRPGQWITGSQLASGLDSVSSSTIATTTRAAVDSGLIERRPIKGAAHGALEWRVTAAGQGLVSRLLSTESRAEEPNGHESPEASAKGARQPAAA